VIELRLDVLSRRIEWERQRKAIRHLREQGEIPLEHSSHDHLNEQIPVPISSEIERDWKEKFRELFAKQGTQKPSVLLFLLVPTIASTQQRQTDVRSRL
jgi:nicotinamide/nicotinate riboside kinase